MNQPIKKNAHVDAAILREHRVVGDVGRLAEKYSVSRLHVLKLIHEHTLKAEQTRAAEFAQTVMRAGEVVYALPASQLQTRAGSCAILEELEKCVKAAGNDANVLIAIAVVPVTEINGTPAAPNDQTHVTPSTLQANAINIHQRASA
jgi:hypothetical protein